jgi:hypothetical protein
MGVNEADIWEESAHSYPGRSGRYAAEMNFEASNLYSDVQLNCQKSAEAIVAQQS